MARQCYMQEKCPFDKFIIRIIEVEYQIFSLGTYRILHLAEVEASRTNVSSYLLIVHALQRHFLINRNCTFLVYVLLH
jgi:hypothetical protein